MEPAETAVYEQQTGKRPETKSGCSSTHYAQLPAAEVRHWFQTNHRSILIQHILLRDSVYVQTLTEADLLNLNITEEERNFSDACVTKLNSLLKQ